MPVPGAQVGTTLLDAVGILILGGDDGTKLGPADMGVVLKPDWLTFNCRYCQPFGSNQMIGHSCYQGGLHAIF